MSFNGSGTFVINSSGQPVVATTLIESSVFNAFTADVATGLSTCITKDGQTVISANIPFAGFYATNVGVRAINGSVGTPAIAFNNSTASGFYRIADNNIGISINGTKVIDVDASRLLMVENLLFTDATYDIGTSASVSVTGRPRDLWLSRNLSVPGTAALSNLDVTGAASMASLVVASISGGVVATQAQMEAGLSNNVLVSPGRQHFHPSAAKAWVSVVGGGSPAIEASYGVTSISDNGTGDWTVNLSITFSSAAFACVHSVRAGTSFTVSRLDTQATSNARFDFVNAGNSAVDPDIGFSAVFMGDI